jgi:hypothetical protein
VGNRGRSGIFRTLLCKGGKEGCSGGASADHAASASTSREEAHGGPHGPPLFCAVALGHGHGGQHTSGEKCTEIGVGLEFSRLYEERREAQEALGPTMRRAPPHPGKESEAVRTGRRLFSKVLCQPHARYCGLLVAGEAREVSTVEDLSMRLRRPGRAVD